MWFFLSLYPMINAKVNRFLIGIIFQKTICLQEGKMKKNCAQAQIEHDWIMVKGGHPVIRTMFSNAFFKSLKIWHRTRLDILQRQPWNSLSLPQTSQTFWSGRTLLPRSASGCRIAPRDYHTRINHALQSSLGDGRYCQCNLPDRLHGLSLGLCRTDVEEANHRIERT